jgi:hypothetical protein
MVTLFVEGTGLPYKVVPINTSKSEQHLPAFRSINPNSQVPASLDTAVERRGCSIRALSCCPGRGHPYPAPEAVTSPAAGRAMQESTAMASIAFRIPITSQVRPKRHKDSFGFVQWVEPMGFLTCARLAHGGRNDARKCSVSAVPEPSRRRIAVTPRTSLGGLADACEVPRFR